ncbi:hypothetical protein NHG29_09085 [Aerococcaceae bacterium NML160702]|nr:hypothetical protein [Aerococcaceae bacterium NML160702]
MTPLAFADFLLYLIQKENEEKLWQIWLAKDIDMDFEIFKKKSLKQTKSKQRLDKKTEQENIANAERILQMKKVVSATNE